MRRATSAVMVPYPANCPGCSSMPIRVEYGTVTLTVTGLPRVFCSRSPPPADPAAAELWVFTAPQQHRPGPSRAGPWAELSPASGWADGLDASVPVVVLSLWVPVLVSLLASVLVSVFAVVSPFALPLAGAGALPMWPVVRAVQPMAASASARRLSIVRPSSGEAFFSALAAASMAVINAARSSTGSSAPRSEEHTSELQSRGHLVGRLL